MAFSHRFTPQVTSLLRDIGDELRGTGIAEFREAWKRFLETHACIVQNEEARLKSAGYEGIVSTKMFNAVRYYYGRKGGAAKPKPPKRVDPTWVRYEPEVYENMRSYISDQMACKPKVSYARFLQVYAMEDSERLKRSYKNTYYRMKRRG